MSAKKTTAKAGGLTPEQWAKFSHALQASKDEQARREAPKKTARALLGKFDGVENWGEYAVALRDCAADINDMLASDEILRIPSRTEFEAEDTAADRAGATMMAMDYRIGMMEAKYYLTLMTALFGAYVEAKKHDPQSVAGLEEQIKEFRRESNEHYEKVERHLRNVPRMVEAATEATEKPMEAADEVYRNLYGIMSQRASDILYSLRKNGWSQNRTSKELHMSRTTVSKIVAAEIVPNMERLKLPIPDPRKRGPVPGYLRDSKRGDLWMTPER